VSHSKEQLVLLGAGHADLLVDVIDRLARVDGTIEADDMRAFKLWSKRETRACEADLVATGASAGDITAWRDGYRRQIALRTKKAKATTD
jgi:hypothetical protein